MTRRKLLQLAALAARPAPLFGEDRPWEARMDNVYANVLYDESSAPYRCWYSPFIQFNDRWDGHRWQRTGAAVTREMALCYAESRDGAIWRTTQPVEVFGRRLRITADARGGPVRAGIVDAGECSLDRRRPVAADVTDAPVQWRGANDLARLAGRRVRLRFALSASRLYAFSFTD